MSLTVYLTLRSVLTAMGCKPPGQDAGQAGLVGERGWEEQCPPWGTWAARDGDSLGAGAFTRVMGQSWVLGWYGTVCRSTLPGLKDTVLVARAHHAGAGAGGWISL